MPIQLSVSVNQVCIKVCDLRAAYRAYWSKECPSIRFVSRSAMAEKVMKIKTLTRCPSIRFVSRSAIAVV